MLAPLLFITLLQLGPPGEDFDRGKYAFGRGEYARTITILRPLLYPEERLTSEGEIVQAHRMLGVSHLFEKQNDLAAQEFRKLLQLRPDYRFDPLLDPPQVVDFFNKVLKEQESALADLETRRQQSQDRERREASRAGPVTERHFVRNSFAVNFIPFGAGQFQNGQRGKGWGFLAVQSSLAALSLGTFVTNFAVYGIRARKKCLGTSTMEGSASGICPSGQIDTSAEQTSKTLTRVQVVSGGLFFAAVAWGIADAIRNFTPETESALTFPVQVGASWQTISLVPTVVPEGGFGTALAFRF